MTLRINLNLEAESRLKTAATLRGVEPEVYARQIIEENLLSGGASGSDQKTLELLARWDAEDATSDPDEIASRDNEIEDFKQSMNENRAKMR